MVYAYTNPTASHPIIEPLAKVEWALKQTAKPGPVCTCTRSILYRTTLNVSWRMHAQAMQHKRQHEARVHDPQPETEVPSLDHLQYIGRLLFPDVSLSCIHVRCAHKT
jgi:hypothetical protein